MTIKTITDEHGHTTVVVTVGNQTETMTIGEWSRLIANPIVILPSPKLVAAA